MLHCRLQKRHVLLGQNFDFGGENDGDNITYNTSRDKMRFCKPSEVIKGQKEFEGQPHRKTRTKAS